MSKIIVVANQKGGVGKSTTASAIASALGSGINNIKYRVLLIDLDAQANTSYTFNAHNSPVTVLEVLTKKATAEEAIIKTSAGLDIIPASILLAGADTIITATGKEYTLKEALEPLQHKYDYIIIDTPPSLGILTVNAFTAGDSVIIPAQADVFSLQGIGQLANTIRAVKKYFNPYIIIQGIVITRYNPRTVLTQRLTEALQDTADSLNCKLFDTKIRECIAIKEAHASKQDIFSYNTRSNGAKDYLKFIDEILKDNTL